MTAYFITSRFGLAVHRSLRSRLCYRKHSKENYAYGVKKRGGREWLDLAKDREMP